MTLVNRPAVEFVTHLSSEPAAPREYRVERIASENDLCVLREKWTALIAEDPQATVFDTWEWVTTWWRHYGDDNDLWVLTAWDAAYRLMGVAPWMSAKDGWGPFRLHRITFVGGHSAGPIHRDVVASPGERDGVAGAFLDYLEAHRGAWDVLDLRNLTPGSPLIAHAADWQHWRRLGPAQTSAQGLAAQWETCEQDAANIPAQERLKLEGEHPGWVALSQIQDLAELRQALTAMNKLNGSPWREQEVAGRLDEASSRAFHKDFASLALLNGWLRFYILRLGEEIAACLYALHYHGMFYNCAAASSPRWANYNLGQIILDYAMKREIEGGATERQAIRECRECGNARATTGECLLLSSTWAGRVWSYCDRNWEAMKAFARRRLGPQDLR